VVDLREGPARTPPVRAALCNLYRLQAADGMYKASNMGQPQEMRLVHVRTFDTKFVVARPAEEAPAAYFLPYSIVSSMR